MTDSANQALRELGLSELEASIYWSLLVTGQQNGNQLSEQVSADRSTVYRVLERLLLMGLVVSSGQRYNCVYSVENIEKIVDLGEKKVSSANNSLKSLKNLLEQVPMLSLEQVLKSKVRVFRGEDSIKIVYQEKNRSGDPILREISNNLVFPCNSLNAAFWNKEIAVRKTNKSFLHQLVDKSDDAVDFHRTSKSQFKEVRVFPDDFVMAAGINVFKNKVAFHNNSVADPLSIIIEDRAMAELMKNFFDFVWNRSQVI